MSLTFVVLSGGFSESDLIDMDAPYPSTMRQDVDDYGYISDSDLESEDDEDLVTPATPEQQRETCTFYGPLRADRTL